MKADPRTLPTWVVEWEHHTTNHGLEGGVLDPRPHLARAANGLPEPSLDDIERLLLEAERYANREET